VLILYLPAIALAAHVAERVRAGAALAVALVVALTAVVHVVAGDGMAVVVQAHARERGPRGGAREVALRSFVGRAALFVRRSRRSVERAGEEALRNLLGTSETDRLARLAGLLYFLTLPTAGPWYYMSAALLGGDVVTLASLQAGRDTLVLAIVLGALGHLVQLASAVVLYRLLSPFGKVAASLLLVLLAVSMPLSFAAMARETDLLALVDGAGGLSALSAEHLQVQITLTAQLVHELGQYGCPFLGVVAVSSRLGVVPLRVRAARNRRARHARRTALRDGLLRPLARRGLPELALSRAWSAKRAAFPICSARSEPRCGS
jgi:hypothetical protein